MSYQVPLLILTGFSLYCTQAYLVYARLLSGPWYYAAGALTAMLGSFCWFRIASVAPSTHSVMVNGLIYDLGIMMAYIVVPILMSRMTGTSNTFWIGLVLTLAGIVTMKLSSN